MEYSYILILTVFTTTSLVMGKETLDLNLNLYETLSPFRHCICIIHLFRSELQIKNKPVLTYQIEPLNMPVHTTLRTYMIDLFGDMKCNGKTSFTLNSSYEPSFKLQVVTRLTCHVTVLVDPFPCFSWKNTAAKIDQLKNRPFRERLLPRFQQKLVAEKFFNYFIHVQVSNKEQPSASTLNMNDLVFVIFSEVRVLQEEFDYPVEALITSQASYFIQRFLLEESGCKIYSLYVVRFNEFSNRVIHRILNRPLGALQTYSKYACQPNDFVLDLVEISFAMLTGAESDRTFGNISLVYRDLEHVVQRGKFSVMTIIDETSNSLSRNLVRNMYPHSTIIIGFPDHFCDSLLPIVDTPEIPSVSSPAIEYFSTSNKYHFVSCSKYSQVASMSFLGYISPFDDISWLFISALAFTTFFVFEYIVAEHFSIGGLLFSMKLLLGQGVRAARIPRLTFLGWLLACIFLTEQYG